MDDVGAIRPPSAQSQPANMRRESEQPLWRVLCERCAPSARFELFDYGGNRAKRSRQRAARGRAGHAAGQGRPRGPAAAAARRIALQHRSRAARASPRSRRSTSPGCSSRSGRRWRSAPPCSRPRSSHLTYGQAKDVAPLACLVMLLLFARSGLYRDRAQRPGFARVIGEPVPGHARDPDLRRDRGPRLQLVLHLLRLAASSRCSTSRPFAGPSSASAASCCAPPATAAAPCSSAPAEHRGGRRTRSATAPRSSPTASSRSRRVTDERPARLPLARAARAALRRDRRGPDRGRRLPAGARRSTSSTAATARACACASRRRRWRS